MYSIHSSISTDCDTLWWISKTKVIFYVHIYSYFSFFFFFWQQQDIVEMEAGPVARPLRRRKTSQNDHSHGSFFLRIGAIGKKHYTV